MPVGGNAVLAAVEKVAAKAKRIAAQLLEAADRDVEQIDDRFRVVGTDRTVDFATVAKAAYRADRPEGGNQQDPEEDRR